MATPSDILPEYRTRSPTTAEKLPRFIDLKHRMYVNNKLRAKYITDDQVATQAGVELPASLWSIDVDQMCSILTAWAPDPMAPAAVREGEVEKKGAEVRKFGGFGVDGELDIGEALGLLCLLYNERIRIFNHQPSRVRDFGLLDGKGRPITEDGWAYKWKRPWDKDHALVEIKREWNVFAQVTETGLSDGGSYKDDLKWQVARQDLAITIITKLKNCPDVSGLYAGNKPFVYNPYRYL